MAFLHFKVQGKTKAACIYCIDGINYLVHNGDYIRIDGGWHNIYIDIEPTRWNIQEEINDNDCIEITTLIDAFGYPTGKPLYDIVSLDEDDIECINGYIKKKNDEERRKINSTLGVILMLMGILGVVMGLFATPMPYGLIVVLSGILFVAGGVLLKKKK